MHDSAKQTQSKPTAVHARKPQAGMSRSAVDAQTSFSRAMGNTFISRITPAQQGVQTKLKVSEPGDQYEREADRMADRVMRMQAPPQPPADVSDTSVKVQRKCEACEREDEEVLRRKSDSGNVGSVSTVSSSMPGFSSLGGGRPLNAAARRFFEPRMGRDFSDVRIHTGPAATAVSEAFHARAFTLGRNVVFNKNQYSPDSGKGRHLLAHELAHVVQNGNGDATIRRAEVEDRDSVCAGLTDIRTDINGFVNGIITLARASPGVSPLSSFLIAVSDRTGGTGAVGPVETFIESLPATKRFLPPASLAGTRFAGLPAATGLGIPGLRSLVPSAVRSLVPDINIYDAHGSNLPVVGTIHVVGATALVNGICVGSDKLGHFFQQGKQYFDIASRSTVADAESFGRATEIDRAGLGATGVYSNADLAANTAGLQFWRDLQADPASYTFDIANYINQNWNEYSNPNFYEASVAHEVWATQLSGRWQGAFGHGPALKSVDVTLTATSSGTITGTFSYAVPPPQITPVTGTITGTITYNTTPVSGTISSSVLHGGSGTHSATPVSSITIMFDWTAGADSGKGRWDSVSEAQLNGTYGHGASRIDAGMFAIRRI